MPQPVDPREQRQAMPDPLSDSIVDGQQRAARFRAESEQRQAQQAEQEQHQRDRQARHQEEARRVTEETEARLFLRVQQAREQAKPQAEPPPTPFYTERQTTELELEQAAGRRQLERYAQRNRNAAAARERIRAEEEAKDIPGFKIDP